MPICPFPGFSEFFLGTPGYIIDDASDHKTSSICNEVDSMGLGHGFKKRKEEGIRICSHRGGHILFVEHIMQQRRYGTGVKNNSSHDIRGLESIGPSSTVKRSGVGERLCARASAVLRTRWTALKIRFVCSRSRATPFTHRDICHVRDHTSP